jgi:serine/threonine protein kinase
VFARKVLSEENGQKEGKNLRELQDSLKSHSHIMTHQAMFIYQGQYNILYDWADCDLRVLLDFVHSDFLDSPGAPRRVLEEASNLVGALSFLHRDLVLPAVGSCICCHMDLKPDNILVFFHGSSFSLKISDLGISKIRADPHSDSRHNHQEFKPKNSELKSELRKLTPRTTKTKPGRGLGEFQAPEMNQPRVGRSSDVWSMGCILIIMIIRTFEGSEALSKFETDRLTSRIQKHTTGNEAITECDTYFHYETDGGYTSIKPAVRKWLSRIESGPSVYVKKLRELRMEQDAPVVILKPLAELIGESLDIDGKRRIKSNQFYFRLQRIVNTLPQFQTLFESSKVEKYEDGTKMLTITHLRTYKKLFNTCRLNHKASCQIDHQASCQIDHQASCQIDHQASCQIDHQSSCQYKYPILYLDNNMLTSFS